MPVRYILGSPSSLTPFVQRKYSSFLKQWWTSERMNAPFVHWQWIFPHILQRDFKTDLKGQWTSSCFMNWTFSISQQVKRSTPVAKFQLFRSAFQNFSNSCRSRSLLVKLELNKDLLEGQVAIAGIMPVVLPLSESGTEEGSSSEAYACCSFSSKDKVQFSSSVFSHLHGSFRDRNMIVQAWQQCSSMMTHLFLMKLWRARWRTLCLGPCALLQVSSSSVWSSKY